MNTILIPIHSFVALITNSSSEVFISATEDTVQTAKDIINSFTGGKYDELFDVKLVYSQYNYMDGTYKEIEIDSDEGREFEENNRNSYTETTEQSLSITPKTNSPEHIAAAENIKKLFSTYDTEGYYNG